MKCKLLIVTAIGLLHLGSAKPLEKDAQLLHKRNDLAAVSTVDGIVTVTAPAAVVYNDVNGQPVTTSYVAPLGASPLPQPVPRSSLAHGSFYSSPAKSPDSGSGSGNSSNPNCEGSIEGYGIAYTPKHADQSFKSQTEVNADFDTFSKTQKYNLVRLYGSDGQQTAKAIKAAKQHPGMKVMAAVFDIKQVTTEIQRIVSDVNGDWDMIHTVDVGNELINKNQATVAQVANAVQTAREMLKKAGYNGCVITIDVFDIFFQEKYRDLCDVSDYVAANAHGFFAGTFVANGDGNWLRGIRDQVSRACGGKPVTITETGWPTEGNAKNLAKTGKGAQQDALSSIKGKFPDGDVVFFEFGDDKWKANQDNPLNIEQHYGMYGKGYNPLAPSEK
ncbi:MAG: hypothetical protein Q9165_002786 [Trypethelium subeluteriae]